MKTYKSLREDIGLLTGAGIANTDGLLFGRKPSKRVFESLGICEHHMVALKFIDGKMTCEMCNDETSKGCHHA